MVYGRGRKGKAEGKRQEAEGKGGKGKKQKEKDGYRVVAAVRSVLTHLLFAIPESRTTP
jgi:hypothetical protein